MSAWDGAFLALAGVLGGALLVVLLQLVSTLREVRKVVADLAPNLDRTARETAQLASHLNQLSEPIADRGESVARFLTALERLGDAVDRVTRLAQTAGAVGAVAGPAVAAALQAVRRSMGGGSTADHDVDVIDEAETRDTVDAVGTAGAGSGVEPGVDAEHDG